MIDGYEENQTDKQISREQHQRGRNKIEIQIFDQAR